MSSRIAIDVGNSRIKVGVFNTSRQLIEIHNFPVEEKIQFYKFLNDAECNEFVVSTVSFPEEEIRKAFNSDVNLTFLTEQTELPVSMNYTSKETLGKDRIAAVMGASRLYAGKNLLIVDAGTCMTIDFLRNDGHWLGGNISPGLNMRWEAMHKRTSRLPLTGKQYIGEHVFGISTFAALANGGLYGMVFEIESYLRYIEEIYGQVNLLMTGGDAAFLEEFLKTEIFVEPHLILEGLYALFENIN
jgi:type III pantothenate kinase